MTLREVWIQQVAPDDYETHMAAVGQAQANAHLVRDLFEAAAIPEGSRVAIAGAGTGQLFDYLPAGYFDKYRLTCTDISVRLLDRLRERVACETVVDDIEDSALPPNPAMIIVVLVLEHVDYRRALASLARLLPERLILVIQENPPQMTTALTPGRPLPASLQVVGDAQPKLIPLAALTEEMQKIGFVSQKTVAVDVPDGKKMIGLLLRPVS